MLHLVDDLSRPSGGFEKEGEVLLQQCFSGVTVWRVAEVCTGLKVLCGFCPAVVETKRFESNETVRPRKLRAALFLAGLVNLGW